MISFTIHLILHLNGMAFYCDASFALKVHVVKHLSFRHLNGLCAFQKAVGQSALAMVNVCDNAKIAYMIHCASSVLVENREVELLFYEKFLFFLRISLQLQNLQHVLSPFR